MKIFEKLKNMSEEEFFRNKEKNKATLQEGGSTTANSVLEKELDNKRVLKRNQQGVLKRPFANTVKDGGNSEYRKNVIQLEKERIEKERYELMMKRKRNSNYI